MSLLEPHRGLSLEYKDTLLAKLVNSELECRVDYNIYENKLPRASSLSERTSYIRSYLGTKTKC